jgi:hypothetical protein
MNRIAAAPTTGAFCRLSLSSGIGKSNRSGEKTAME